MAFIRKVKTQSGAIAVQIVHKNYGQVTRIDHIGSAHSQVELAALTTLAKQRLLSAQQSITNTAQTILLQLIVASATPAI
jgi:hypothetical protein